MLSTPRFRIEELSGVDAGKSNRAESELRCFQYLTDKGRLALGPYLRRIRERVGVGPPRSVSASRCDTEDRDFCSGTRMTRARRVTGVVLHDDDLLDVATDDRT